MFKIVKDNGFISSSPWSIRKFFPQGALTQFVGKQFQLTCEFTETCG